MKFLGFFFLCCVANTLSAQSSLTLPATHAAYDSVLQLLLVQADEQDLVAASQGVITESETYAFLKTPDTLVYDSTYHVVTSVNDTVTLAFTPLPLIQISSENVINRDKKVIGSFSYGDDVDSLTSPIGLRYRGSYSLRYPKKSLDLEFRDPTDPEETQDATFLDLREDDDWVLDALYNEPSRVNAYVAHRVWLDLHRPHYQEEEPEARSGAGVAYTELFLNGRYHGLYLLSEQVDRKQLKLKKYKDGVRGELYKSEAYTEATRFLGVPNEAVKNDDWAGWEVKHPDEDEVDWERLRDLIRFVSASSDSLFLATAAERFELDNLTDYLLFVNGLWLMDNVSKNSYLARYDSVSPYFYAPWDLDAGLGNTYDAQRNTNMTGWSTNQLFRRLSDLNAGNFNDRLCARYTELRTGILSPDSLQARVTTAMNYLRSSGAYRREEIRWPDLLNYSEEQAAFTNDFIAERSDFMDGYVCSITTPTREILASGAPSLRVYPNPASAYLTVEGVPEAADLSYALYSVTGREVMRGRLRPSGRVDVESLSSGLYFLRIGSQVGRVVVAD